MNTNHRRRLAMAIRVRDFCRAHPYANERYAAAVARLEDRTARAQALDTQQQGGRLLVRAMTVSREALKRTIREQYLKPLAAIAVAVSAEEPELAARFKQLLLTPGSGNVAETRAFIEEDTKRWIDVIKEANIPKI